MQKCLYCGLEWPDTEPDKINSIICPECKPIGKAIAWQRDIKVFEPGNYWNQTILNPDKVDDWPGFLAIQKELGRDKVEII